MDVIVERVEGNEGDKIEITDVNLFSDGTKVEVGFPTIKNVVVEATIKKHLKGDKVIAFKYKPKKRYRRKVGHRQLLTLLHFDKIVLSTSITTGSISTASIKSTSYFSIAAKVKPPPIPMFKTFFGLLCNIKGRWAKSN